MAAGSERTHQEERTSTRAAPAAPGHRREACAEQPFLALQRKIGNQATADLLDEERDRETSTVAGAQPPSVVYDVLNRPGVPLEGSVRAVMESRFNADFAPVRIHQDSRAQGSAAAVGARAYTVGRDIVFGAPGFNANDPSSVATLAHELTHTVQNGAFPWQGEQLELDSPDTEEEREAASAGAAVSRELDDARAVSMSPSGGTRLMRQLRGSTHTAGQTMDKDDLDTTARAVADVLQRGSLRLLGPVPSPHRSAVADLQACVTSKQQSTALTGEQRLRLLERSRTQLEPLFRALAGDSARRVWLDREITPYLGRLGDAVQLQIARERVGRAELVGEKVIDPTATEGTREGKEALRTGVGKMIETVGLLNEQVIRFGHEELHEFAHELAKGEIHGVHKKPTDPGYLVEVQNLLVLIHGMLSLSDEELAHELNKPHGVLGVVASGVELVRIVTEIIGGTLGATFSFAGVVAKLSKGQEAYAAQALGIARGIGLTLGNIIAGIEIVHGAVVLLDAHASDEKRLEGARDVASGAAWFIGSKVGGAAVGGAASTAILVTYKELELIAQLHGEARIGIVAGWMTAAFEGMGEAAGAIAAAGRELAKAGYLAVAETHPAQQQALAKVEQENASQLAVTVDSFLEQCRPTGYGVGAAYRPGAYAVLRPVFAPLMGRVGAKTPTAAANAATDVLAAIRWCFEHAQELQLKEAGYEPKPAEHAHGSEGD